MVIDEAQRSFGTGHHACFYGFKRAVVRLKPGCFRGGIVRHHGRDFRLPGIHTVKKIFSPKFMRGHIYQLLDVDRRKDCLLGAVLASILTFDSSAFSVLNNQTGYNLVQENDPAVSLDITGQGLRKSTRPSLRNAAWRGPNRSVRQTSSHRILGRLVGKWAGQQECAAMIVLKIVADDLPLRHSRAALPKVAVGYFHQSVVQGLAEADGRESNSFKDGAHRLELG